MSLEEQRDHLGLKGGIMEITGGTPMASLTEGQRFDASVMRVNVDPETIYRNIRANLRSQIRQFSAYSDNPQHVCIVGGGWSLDEPSVYEELRDLFFSGAVIVALNGSAKWLRERNIRPAMHVILDARPENIEFIREETPNCKYFLASQVDPSLAALCKDRDTYLFHAFPADGTPIEHGLCDAFYGKGRWLRIPACSSVGITSILLLRYLGFRYQHLFGIDSCYRPDGKHHAFDQPLNNEEGSALFQVGKEGRVFRCSAWMAAQAQSFRGMIEVNHPFLTLAIHGDGLLAYLLKTAAEMPLAPIGENTV